MLVYEGPLRSLCLHLQHTVPKNEKVTEERLATPNQNKSICYYKLLVTDSEGVSLLPRYGRPPGVEPHLVRQRFGHGQQDEADVGQSDQCGHQNHQVVSVPGRQVRTDGRTRHQACCESRGHLVGEGGSGGEKMGRLILEDGKHSKGCTLFVLKPVV